MVTQIDGKGNKMSGRMQRIAVLQSEVEAQFLDSELTARNIPHMMRSYHDSALDGLFQVTLGWGHVEAPPAFKATVLDLLKQARATLSGTEGNES